MSDSKKDHVDTRITIRLTAEQKILMDELADNGQNSSELLRGMVEAAKPGLKFLLRGLKKRQVERDRAIAAAMLKE